MLSQVPLLLSGNLAQPGRGQDLLNHGVFRAAVLVDIRGGGTRPGFAAKPGTEVLPTCSMATAGTPAAAIARAYPARPTGQAHHRGADS
jgi:hypothetical protein